MIRQLALALPLLLTASWSRAQEPFRFVRENVLGTSSSLIVAAPDRATAERAETAVFAAVDRLAAIVSTWDATSELRLLLQAGSGAPSAELTEVVALGEQWRSATSGALDPAVAKLSGLWQAAEATGKAPDAAALASAVAGLPHPAIDIRDGKATCRGPVTFDAFAKGWIVDRASAAVASVPGATLVAFQIGGDTRVGKAAHECAIADPRQPADNGTPLCTVRLAGDAVATSGGYARGFTIAGTHRSHILDPRTGQPCDGVLGASVLAADTATADALATALCVLGVERGMPLLVQHHAEGVLVTADGAVHQSRGFEKRLVAPIAEAAAGTAPDAGPADANTWPQGFGLTVEFELAGPAGGGSRGWKRPYVAVWVEDQIGDPARTLCIWLENRRWLRDLRRWSRQYAELPEVIDTISQATRKAGHYTLTWDGTSDAGSQLAPGTYTVYVEVVREHGTYQLMKHEFELRSTPVEFAFDGNTEVTAAKVVFGKLAKGQKQ